MAGTFDYLRFRAFAHATEDPERVRQAVRFAARSPALALEEETLEGSHKNPIVAFEGDVRANPTIRAIFAGFAQEDPDGFERLVEDAPRRLDEHLNLYFRLDKQEAYQQRAVLTYGDDAVLVRARVNSFAAKRSSALDEVLGFLKGIPTPQPS